MQRIDRAIRRLASQDTARTNASQASAKLRKRRHEQEDVDAYLGALRRTNSTTARDAHGSSNSAHGAAPIADTR
jgi:hypothetical protein